MKFKVLKGTKTYDALVALYEEMGRCNEEAKKLAEEVGVSSWHVQWGTIGGGISAFIFDKKPAGWGNAYASHEKGCYMPKRNLNVNKELLAKIDALPVVDDGELNKIVGYIPHKHCSTNRRCTHPGFSMFEESGYALLSFSEAADRYKPIPDLIEITVSEYNTLKEAGK